MTFAENVDGVDPRRIALWGDSYTGGQVIVVGAMDQRVRAIVAQVPVFGAKPPDVDADKATFDRSRRSSPAAMCVDRRNDRGSMR